MLMLMKQDFDAVEVDDGTRMVRGWNLRNEVCVPAQHLGLMKWCNTLILCYIK